MSQLSTRIIKFTESLINSPLSHSQLNHIQSLIKYHTKSNTFSGSPLNELVMNISLEARDSFINTPHKSLSFNDPIDIQSMLSDMITQPFGPNDLSAAKLLQSSDIRPKPVQLSNNLSNILDKNTLFNLTRSLNPTATHSTAYITLDSLYASFSDNNTKLRWDYLDALSESPTSTNTTSKIRDVISIRIHSIVLSKFTSVLGRATILIEEFSAQSFIAPNGRKFHTINSLYDLEIPNLVDATVAIPNQGFSPDISHDKYALFTEYSYNNGIYNFNTPITSFDSITLSFGNPFDLISIKKPKIYNCSFDSINYDSTATAFDPGWAGVFVINTGEPHYHTGDFQSIKISDFSTDQPIVDSLFITFINSMEFTSATVIDSTHIEIYPHHILPPGPSPYPLSYIGSGLPNDVTGVPTTFTMTFDGYRIIATVEMTYLNPKFN